MENENEDEDEDGEGDEEGSIFSWGEPPRIHDLDSDVDQVE